MKKNNLYRNSRNITRKRLSIGMALDANVIIFTLIKEEIGLGTSVTPYRRGQKSHTQKSGKGKVCRHKE